MCRSRHSGNEGYMIKSDKRMRLAGILILAVLAIYVLAYTFTFVKNKKEVLIE